MISMVSDMECKGNITAIAQDFETKGILVTLSLTEVSVQELQAFKAMDELAVSIKKYRKKRSLDANAYFHLLVGKLADKLRISKIRCKNIMIGRYGQVDYIDNQPVMIKTQIPVSDMLEQENLHCLPCGGKTEENGLQTFFYRVYRGSHTYNTEEMSILIDGVVQEAREQGIETETPDEIERLKSLWKGKNNG